MDYPLVLKVLQIRRDNKESLWITFPYFSIKTYVVSPHQNSVRDGSN